MTMRRRHLRVTVATVATLVLVVTTSTSAWAQFRQTVGGGSMSLATGALAPPTSPVASHGSCTPVVGASVIVSWTPTASTWADGYVVSRALAAVGPFVDIATVSGQAATSYQDAALAFSTTLYYRVTARKQAWRSAASSTVSITTKNVLCL